MKSSVAIIMETTGLLRPACLPDCWPRDFSSLKPTGQYIGYIQMDLYDRDSTGITNFAKSKRAFPEVNSSFYSLIDDATNNYAAVVRGVELTREDIRSLSNDRVRVVLISEPKGDLTDRELGYIQLSPVIVNAAGNKGVFFYGESGEFFSSWLMCIRKNENKWILVSRSRLAIS